MKTRTPYHKLECPDDHKLTQLAANRPGNTNITDSCLANRVIIIVLKCYLVAEMVPFVCVQTR